MIARRPALAAAAALLVLRTSPPGAETGTEPPDAASLASWGITAEAFPGKIPLIRLTLDWRRAAASLPRLRAAGLAPPDASGEAVPPRPALCRDLLLAALPVLLRRLYDGDPSLDYALARAYVVLPAEQAEGGDGTRTEMLFSFNATRDVARRLGGRIAPPAEVARAAPRYAPAPWLEGAGGGA